MLEVKDVVKEKDGRKGEDIKSQKTTIFKVGTKELHY